MSTNLKEFVLNGNVLISSSMHKKKLKLFLMSMPMLNHKDEKEEIIEDLKQDIPVELLFSEKILKNHLSYTIF